MKKLAKLFIGASLLTALFAGCSNGGLISNDTLDAPELTATVTENGVAVIKWDYVKDAEYYSVYYKVPGAKEWNYIWNDIYTNHYVYSIDKKDLDSEYEFKVVAHPFATKTNLLASESEISVDTPEAWVDTAAFTAGDIKLTLVPNTLNKYELRFPVDAGFKYTAKFVAVTSDASANAKDLFNQTAEYWYISEYTNSSGNILSIDAYYNLQNQISSDYSSFVTSALSYIDSNNPNSVYVDDDEASAAINAFTLSNNSTWSALETVIDNIPDGDSNIEAIKDTLDTAFTNLKAEYNYFTSFSAHWTSGTDCFVNQIVYKEGASFITELDDDDNVVSPVITSNAVVNNDKFEYRVVVQMTPVNTEVATEKYILSSQTVKFDSTGLVSAPENLGFDLVNSTSTKRILTFTAARKNGTVMPVTNYRIYQVLNTQNFNADGIDIGETTALKYLGNPVLTDKSSTYNPDEEEDIKYEYKAVLDEDTSKVDYTYTFYVAYTDQNGTVSWYRF